MPYEVYLIGRSEAIRLDSDAHQYSEQLARRVFLRNGKRVAEIAEDRIEAIISVDDESGAVGTGLAVVGAKMVG